MEELNTLDHQLMLWLNFDGGIVLDFFWYWLSYKWTLIPLYLLIIFGLWRSRLNNRQFVITLLTVILVVFLCDQISSGLIKPFVERLRPSHDPLIEDQLHYVYGYRSGRYGFVSSHAANVCGVVVFLWHEFKKRIIRMLLLAWIILICYSRIYLGVHFPGDILGGLAVGIFVGYACHFGTQTWKRQ